MWALCWFIIYFLFVCSNAYLFLLPFGVFFSSSPYSSRISSFFQAKFYLFHPMSPPPFSLSSLPLFFHFSIFLFKLFFTSSVFLFTYFHSFFFLFFYIFLFYISPYFCVSVFISIISQFILFIFSVYFSSLSLLLPFHFFSQPSFLFHSFPPQKPNPR